MKELVEQLKTIWTDGTASQKAFAMLSGVVVVCGLSASVFLATRPDFALLFGNLDPSDASQVVEAVRATGVEVEVRDGGRSIFVPRAAVAETRMTVSAQGLPRGGSKGWELFDGSAFGVSEFVQNINLRRALEGELARTIRSFDSVSEAQVKISAARRSPFVGDDRPAKASVVITPRSGRELGAENVSAIEHLVAGAVEGLGPDNVRVIDTRGRVLSRPHEDPMTAVASTQMDYRLKQEADRRRTAQEMLDRMGVQADVRVALEMDFQQVNETSEKYDPTGTVTSETIDNKSSMPAAVVKGGATGASAIVDGNNVLPASSGTTEETEETITSTYSVGKTVRSQQRITPQITRISVSLVVHEEHQERMNEIEEQVKAAVGYVDGRDVIRSMAHAFKAPEVVEAPVEEGGPGLMSMILERVVQILGILGALYLVLRILRTVEKRQEAPVADGDGLDVMVGAAAGEPEFETPQADSPKVEDLVRVSVEQDPAGAARILRGWLHEGEPN